MALPEWPVMIQNRQPHMSQVQSPEQKQQVPVLVLRKPMATMPSFYSENQHTGGPGDHCASAHASATKNFQNFSPAPNEQPALEYTHPAQLWPLLGPVSGGNQHLQERHKWGLHMVLKSL